MVRRRWPWLNRHPYTLLLHIGMPVLDGFAVVRTPSGKSALRFAAGWGIWHGLSVSASGHNDDGSGFIPRRFAEM
jgi:hypothetical protein